MLDKVERRLVSVQGDSGLDSQIGAEVLDGGENQLGDERSRAGRSARLGVGIDAGRD